MDRAAHRRTDADWLALAWSRSRVVVVDIAGGGRFLVTGDSLVLFAPEGAPAADPADRLFLGEHDGTPYFAVAAPLPDVAGARTVNLRDVGHALDDRDAGLAITAVALAHWHAAHAYAPATGRPTTPSGGGWVRTDEEGEQLWPRTDPAVIVLVNDGVAGPDGRCLLGHNAGWAVAPGVRRFSCLAGFVEPGESAEAAVVREVFEEVGVVVADPTYVGSQAWPFPGSLMLGFTAYADPAAPVRVDPTEITHAHWFTRSEVAAVFGGEVVRTGDGERVGLPMGASIAHFLVTEWVNES